MGRAAQRCGEWASASRTFSAMTGLIAVVQREVHSLCSFFSPCMHAPPPPGPACMLRLLLTAATFLAVKASPPDVEMARLVALRYAVSRRQSRAACVTVHALFTSFSL